MPHYGQGGYGAHGHYKRDVSGFVGGYGGPKCTYITLPICHKIPVQIPQVIEVPNCAQVPKEHCVDTYRKVPETVCTNVPQQVCKQVPYTVPIQLPVEKCIDVPKEVCVQVPEQISKEVCAEDVEAPRQLVPTPTY